MCQPENGMYHFPDKFFFSQHHVEINPLRYKIYKINNPYFFYDAFVALLVRQT
jgi:hypothetical protein